MGAENSKLPYSLTGQYGATTLECDIVMKGGITSGVVYPLAICKLAETYRFRSIGGASAGAIAAVATAAAEAARQAHPDSPGRGFAKLQDLPAELARRLPSGRSRLLSLFQPARDTRTAFDVILASIGPRPLPGKVLRVVTLVARRHPFVPVIALGMAIFVVWSAARLGRWQDIPVAAISVLLLLAGGLLGAVVLAARASALAIARNGGGICSGHGQSSRPDEPALAAWLDHLFNDVAGRPDGDPLTFGELRAQGIELAMMTTNLTHGRPHRLPFTSELFFFFRKSEMAALFPARVVDWLVAKGRESLSRTPRDRHETDRQHLGRRILAANGGDASDFVPLPTTDDLPVVVAVRMSLSFPVLLSAVPLHTVDWTMVRHPRAGDDTTSRPTAERPPDGAPRLERCWFSDGGICSNLPIHFFDSLLPSRPTFALDLREAHPHHPVRTPPFTGTDSELDNVWIPERAGSGFAEQWARIGTATGELPIAALVGAMVDTMQNWNDNMLAKSPGYRDRIVHISHMTSEGGLNLDMPANVITRLSERGAAAGYKLGRRFDPAAPRNGWDNHLWVRYRSALGMLQGLLGGAQKRYFATPEGRQRIEDLVKNPPSYTLSGAEKAAAERVNTEFAGFKALDTIDLEERAPRPWSELRARPRGD